MKRLFRKILGKNRYLALHAMLFGKDVIVGPFRYNEDGLATKDQAADFLSETKFSNSYSVGKATGSWIRSSEIRWRVKVVLWAAEHALKLEGDFVECGVNKGGYARAIYEYTNLKVSGKKFWLLDTYNGIPAGQAKLSNVSAGIGMGSYQDCYEEVTQTFASFSNARIVKGMIPDTLNQVTSEKISYLSIDMNIAIPEIAAAIYFWDKLVPGGIIVLDDYNFVFHPEQRTAFDAFAQERGCSILPLPTGQGLMIKPPKITY